MKTRLFCGIVVALSPATVDAQAFGVQMGAPVSKYAARSAGMEDPNFYKIAVPEPNGEFETYLAIATPRTGVCKVVGLGKTHFNDDYGSDTRSAFDSIKSALASRYGNSKDFDFLKYGALWDQPREWVWSIYKNERTLTSFWDAEEHSTLPNDVESIELDTKSVNPSSGAYVTLSYEFTNFARCQADMQQRNNNGL